MKNKQIYIFSALGCIAIHVLIHMIPHFFNENMEREKLNRFIEYSTAKTSIDQAITKLRSVPKYFSAPKDIKLLPHEGKLINLFLYIGPKENWPKIEDQDFLNLYEDKLYYAIKEDTLTIYDFGPDKVNDHGQNDDIFNTMRIWKMYEKRN